MFTFIRRGGAVVGASMALIAALIVGAVPAGAADITITVANANDVPITQVVLNDNGSVVTQNASVGGTSDNDDDPVDFVSVTVNDGGTLVLDEFNVATISTANYNFPGTLSGVTAWENGSGTGVNTAGFEPAVDRVLSSLDLRD